MSKLTEKQERFAAEVAKGASYTQAYRTAYPTSLKWPDKDVWSRASHTAADSKVKARVAELKAPALEAAQYGVVEAMGETDRYLLMAAEDRAWGPVGAMLKHKAMLKGLLLSKVEVSVGEFGKFTAHQKLAAIDALRIEMNRRKALDTDVEDVADKLDDGDE